MNPTEAELDRWIAEGWDRPPVFARSVLREMYLDEKARDVARDAADWRTKRIEELGRRVGQLETLLGPGCKRLVGDIAKGFGKALAESRTRERERLLAEIEKRGFVTYGGVWDEATDYARGTLVTHGGSAWVALTPAEKGLRPGKAPAWRLAVKGESSKGVVTA
jgi:hypothetical protein